MAKPMKKSDSGMMSEEDICCEPGMSCCGDYACDAHGGRKSHAKQFTRVAAGLLFLVLAIWVGLQIWGNPWYKNIRAEFTATPYARTITVDGEGKVTVKPDIARISLSVASAGKTVKEVTDDNNKKMNAVVDELKKLGVKPEDIQTSSYYLNPEYDYGYPPVVYSNAVEKEVAAAAERSVPKIIGYTLNQTVDVKIRDLTKSDQVIDRSIAAGANQVGSLSFDLDDASQVKKDARKEAFGKAREKAEEMAGAAGVKLGKVVTFSEGYNAYPMPYANFSMRAGDVAESAVAPALEPGSKEFTINVSVTYEIE